MKRYVSAPARCEGEWIGYQWEAFPSRESCARVLIEQERSVRDTGLLDASGGKIFAVDETAPIGFVPLGERAKA